MKFIKTPSLKMIKDQLIREHGGKCLKRHVCIPVKAKTRKEAKYLWCESQVYTYKLGNYKQILKRPHFPH